MRTNFFLTTTNLATYTVTLFLTAGTHAIGLAFLNDYYAPPEDRNAFFSQLTIAPLPAFQIIDLNADATQPSVTLRWETTPNAGYEVQFNPRLQPTNWQSLATVTSSASITSWKDDGTLSGMPPLTPGAPQRFYRIHNTSP
jgi:hypothetical protein